MVFSDFSIFSKVSSSDLIILILSQDWPLSAKQLFNRVVKEKGSNISYQAVHKTILDLLEKDVLLREKNSYKLNSEWISKVKKFGESLDVAYSTNQKVDFETDFEKPHLASFDYYNDAILYMIYDFHGKLPNPEHKENLCFWSHTWAPIGISSKEFDKIVELFKSEKYYALTKHDTFLDRYFAEFLSKIGKLDKTGVPFSAHEDSFVHGDFVGQVFYEPEFKKRVHKLYNKITKIEQFDIKKFFTEILSKKTKINFLTFKNKELAQKLREETLKHFK